jgi:hypothetical protein
MPRFVAQVHSGGEATVEEADFSQPCALPSERPLWVEWTGRTILLRSFSAKVEIPLGALTLVASVLELVAVMLWRSAPLTGNDAVVDVAGLAGQVRGCARRLTQTGS